MKSLTKNVLIIGGKGKNGRRVAEKLKSHKFNPIVTTRTINAHVENERYFDWNDSSTFGPALKNIEIVYIVHPDTSMLGAEQQIEGLITEMMNQSVSKAVLLSGRGQASVEKCEKILMQSQLDWTVIRSAWFNQNFSEGHFLHGIRSGEVTFMADTVKEPFVDLEDLSDVVVECLIDAVHNGKIYEVTGPELLTFAEAVNVIGVKLKRNIQYQYLNQEAYRQYLKNAGLDEFIAAHMTQAFSEILDGRNENIGKGVTHVLGRDPIKFTDFVKSNKF